MILTASLTTGVARVTYGLRESVNLVDAILATDHVHWETTLFVGDVEYRSSKTGPIPNHQLRFSVSTARGLAALNYMDNDDPAMPIANSYNPRRPVHDLDLIFNGSTGAVFPRTALIPVSQTRAALLEWLETRTRPTCVEWRPYDSY
ncbi:Imm1 family immunity protein [Amycolatopsis sp. NPDC005232]|uniref:Imm1 family immunity protein n=1 Tax=Amycolatopsis sp. NPDC005232 TaxID=3157027 RepID=UPI0033B1A410